MITRSVCLLRHAPAAVLPSQWPAAGRKHCCAHVCAASNAGCAAPANADAGSTVKQPRPRGRPRKAVPPADPALQHQSTSAQLEQLSPRAPPPSQPTAGFSLEPAVERKPCRRRSSSAAPSRSSGNSGSSSSNGSSSSSGSSSSPTAAGAAEAQQQTAAGEAADPSEPPSDEVPASAGIPSEAVWRRDLRKFQGMMSNPKTPWIKTFILRHCYTANTPATQAWYRSMEPQQMHRTIRDRVQLERRLSLSAHALQAAWQRLQRLAEAVCDQGAVLDEPQLAKEREQVVGMIERLQEGQTLLARATSRAAEVGDQSFLRRAVLLRQLLVGLTSTAEAYLREYLRRVGAASRINQQFRDTWAATPPSSRAPLHVVESKRQAQLAQLQALLPPHPTHLLAEYREAALAFECYKDTTLFQRKASPGLPSSTGGVFWEQQQDNNMAAAAAAALPPIDALYASSGSSMRGQQQAGQQQPNEQELPQQQQQQQQLVYDPRQVQAQEQPQQQAQEAQPLQQQQQQQQQAGLWDERAPTWQQPSQQQMARPVQQLPLLPHLARHRQWLAPLQQQQEQLRQQAMQQAQLAQHEQDKMQQQGEWQQQQGYARRLQQQQLARPPSLPQQQQQQQGPSPGADDGCGSNKALPLSFSGKVIPPVPVLLQRALKLEQQQLMREAGRRAGNGRMAG